MGYVVVGVVVMSSGVTGNKAELATKLGISLPTLSGWMLRYPEFPVLSKGSNGKSYVFDFPTVFDFLRARQDEQARSRAEKDDALAQLRLPFDLPGIEPAPAKTTAKEEFDALRLRKFQREEAAASGALVPAAEILAGLTAVLSRLSRDGHAFIRQIAREQSWPDPYTRQLEARFGDLQRAAVKDLSEQLASEAVTPAHAYG